MLVLTKSVKVFAFGWNECGQAGIGNNKSFISKFTEISSLKPYIIKNVYAGYNYSLFQTSNGKILACGKNGNDECFINNDKNDIFAPIETSIKKKC